MGLLGVQGCTKAGIRSGGRLPGEHGDPAHARREQVELAEAQPVPAVGLNHTPHSALRIVRARSHAQLGLECTTQGERQIGPTLHLGLLQHQPEHSCIEHQHSQRQERQRASNLGP